MSRTKQFRVAWRTVTLSLALLLPFGLANVVRGEEPSAASTGSPASAPPRDPIAERLFAPELVMGHQSEVGLTAAQREAVIHDLQRLQSELVPLQFELQAAAEALGVLLSTPRIDEERALAQAKRVMELEGQVKAKHLALLVRIKNLLSPEQQERLVALRAGARR